MSSLMGSPHSFILHACKAGGGESSIKTPLKSDNIKRRSWGGGGIQNSLQRQQQQLKQCPLCEICWLNHKSLRRLALTRSTYWTNTMLSFPNVDALSENKVQKCFSAQTSVSAYDIHAACFISHTCPQSWAPIQKHGIWNSSTGPW